MVMFHVYRTLDFLLVIFFLTLFPWLWLGIIASILLIFRILLSHFPGNDAVLFDLRDCGHHHMPFDGRKP